jgi:predicted nucleic acid-binding Zn ribbon protein
MVVFVYTCIKPFVTVYNRIIMEEKLCPECGKSIIGRADKKFCSDDCRSAFNNTKNRNSNNMMRKVNSTLKRNRDIMLSFNPQGKANIAKSKLQDAGFNFNYHTNSYTTKTGKTYYFCYDQGYLALENDYFSLVVKQEYIG